MKGLALLRYLAADAMGSQRWVPPAVLFLVATVAGTAAGGTALGCYGFSATVLLPVALWLSVTVVNSEDPIQAAVTVVTVGSSLVVQLGKLAVAYLGCLVLMVLGVGWPLITGHPARGVDLAAGVAGHLLTALAGVALGSVLSRPVLRTPTWVVLGGVAAVLAELLVPGLPPTRAVAVLFAQQAPSGSQLMRSSLPTAAETVLGAALLVGLGHRIAVRRN